MATIVRWEPFRDLLTTQDRFNRLFNDTFARAFGGGDSGEESGTRSWAPAVDVLENDQNVVLKADLPGVDPKDVEIRIQDNTLTLKGERKFEKDVKEGNYQVVERSYGSFFRGFSLPAYINSENVTADYKDGLLTLTLPKREEAKPKVIKLNEATKAIGASK
ncbi:MAG: Hsp20/alpha crystallin family protein [Terriglobia bacterium]